MNNKMHLLLDLEATCCNDASFPREEMEIIEIGAVIVDAINFHIQDEFQVFVKPIRHPQLTPFCKELTSIEQDQVDTGLPYKEALEHLKLWIKQYECVDFCSWGAYDKNQFLQDCKFHEVPYPFEVPHRNLKLEFSKYLGVSKGFGMSKALKRIGLEIEGTHHRALDDARNIAKIFKHMNTQETPA